MPSSARRLRLAVALAGASVVLAASSLATAAWSSSAAAGPQPISTASVAPPGNPSATVACVPRTSLSVGLEWDPSGNATSYLVSRATSSAGPFSPVGTTPGTNFTDPTVNELTTYYYIATGVLGDWGSPASGAAAVTTPRLSNCR